YINLEWCVLFCFSLVCCRLGVSPGSLSLFLSPLSLSLLCCRVEEWPSVSAPVCFPLCQQMTPPCSSQVVMPCLIFHAPSTLSICFLCVCVLSLSRSIYLSLSLSH